ncbi:hypothetical protein EI555_001700, partial [Monodon monoceros]
YIYSFLLQSASSSVHLCDKKKMELSLNIPVNYGPQEESCGSSQLHKTSVSPGTSRTLSAPQDNDFLSRKTQDFSVMRQCPVNHSFDSNISVAQRATFYDHSIPQNTGVPYENNHSKIRFYALLFCFSSNFTHSYISVPTFLLVIPCFSTEQFQPGITQQWIQSKREDIVNQMTEACLNQSLDALLSRDLIMKEDYELISTKPTRTSKVRQLLDTSDIQGEEFAKVIVQKLKDNKQMGLQPYPEILVVSQSPSLNLFHNKNL